MKKSLFLLFLLAFMSNISSAQTGWGYVNYTSYKLYGGNGSTTQYQAFPYSRTEFDNMLNTANSNTTITNTGEVPISYVYNGSTQTPHWNGDYYAIKFDFWFIPKVTGTYYFGINSDDASDLVIDGALIATYYGGHGASGYQTGQMNMVAGQRYKVVVRYQEYGGGDALYFRWYRPGVGWGYWNDEVTNIGVVPTKQAKMTFDFGNTLDKTKLSVGGAALSSAGLVDVTNSLDSNKIANGNKGTIVSGQVEWSYINTTNGTNTLYVDLRKFGNTDVATVTEMKILDVYEGPVTYVGSNIYWAYYTIPSSLPKLTNGTSTYASAIRSSGYDNYGLSCDVTFGSVMKYKQQSITMTTTNTLSTMYNSIVTVSDVYLAFKELVNGGLFGNQTGNEFTYGIQYKNADVNDDGVFNEADTYRMIQYLTGAKPIVDTFTFGNVLRLIPTSSYNNIGKSNWSTSPLYLGGVHNFDINTGNATDTFYMSGTWKGDVNLSHSATPASNGITTMSLRTMSTTISNEITASIVTEIVGDSIYAYITLDPLQQFVVGTQFQINYDNSVLKYNGTKFTTKGNPTNFSNDKGAYVNVGSLISDGTTSLDKTTTYKISFLSTTKLDNIFGLISISATDAINKDGQILKIRIN